MFLKRILPVSIIFLASAIGFWKYQNPCVESIDSTYQNGWQGENPFSIKVERVPESCSFAAVVAGANYIFSARQGNSENWHEIMTYRFDDPIELKSEYVRIVNENTAYIFIIDRYAVTTDSGKTWKIWNAEKDLTDWKRAEDKYPNWAKIDEINLEENGSGKMKLERVNSGKGLTKELHTNNFGKTWIP